ncbi:MAG TPA: DNA alkylation repair protein [Kofleriaceae bacterium]|nr:DNA alkylation repair protein [Kofleriaceae bacterium]
MQAYQLGSGLRQFPHRTIVLYDSFYTPKLSTESSLRLWPFETAYGVMEVKSRLSPKALKDAVENIAAFKHLSRVKNNLAGGLGFKMATAQLNLPLGFLIAHEPDTALLPSSADFLSLLEAVPRDQRIDGYCTVSGYVGWLGQLTEEDGQETIASKEFFLRKAIGWALRQHSRTDPAAVKRYVAAHPELSGLSKREALKHV